MSYRRAVDLALQALGRLATASLGERRAARTHGSAASGFASAALRRAPRSGMALGRSAGRARGRFLLPRPSSFSTRSRRRSTRDPDPPGELVMTVEGQTTESVEGHAAYDGADVRVADALHEVPDCPLPSVSMEMCPRTQPGGVRLAAPTRSAMASNLGPARTMPIRASHTPRSTGMPVTALKRCLAGEADR